MGFPLDQLGKQVDIVAELYRLSEGDPLLVRLYVDDLWARGEEAARLQPDDLKKIKPGLKGYFDEWKEAQEKLWHDDYPLEKPVVEELFNVLSCAWGPLKQDDILRLASSQVRLTTRKLEGALRPLRRFIIGDGRNQGYAFSHPCLGSYFYDELSQGEHQELESRFLNWGKETLKALNEKQIEPKNVSPYIIQYYSAHLIRAGCDVQDFVGLLSEGWQQAWFSLEGSYSGFLNEVKKVWDVAKVENGKSISNGKAAVYLGTEIRCALYQSSIISLLQNIPSKLLLILVEKQVWTLSQGIAYARQIPVIYTKFELLTKLACRLQLQEPRRSEILAEVRDLVEVIEDKNSRAQALCRLAALLPEAKRREALLKALVIAETAVTVHVRQNRCPETTIEWWAQKVLKDIARQLPDDLLDELLVAVRMIAGEDQVKVLRKLAPHFPKRRHEILTEALATACVVEDESGRARALGYLVPHLPKALLTKVLLAAKAIEDKKARAQVLSKLTPHLTEVQQHKVLIELLELVQLIIPEYVQAELLGNLVARLPEDLLAKALEVAQSIKDKEERARLLIKLAPRLPQVQQQEVLEKAWVLARAISDKWRRVRTLSKLIQHLPETQRHHLLEETLATVESIKESWCLANALSNLVPYLLVDSPVAFVPQFQRISAGLNMIEVKRQLLIMTMHKLASHLSKEEMDDVLTEFRPVRAKDYRVKVKVLCKFVMYLSEEQRYEVLEQKLGQVLAAVRAIRESEQYRSQILVELLPYLPDKLLKNDALRIAQLIGDEEDRARILGKLALYLPEAQQLEVLATEFAMMTLNIGSQENRVRTLSELALHLPETMQIEVLLFAIESAKEIKDARNRIEILVELMLKFPELQQHELLIRDLVADATSNQYVPEKLRKLSLQLLKTGRYRLLLESVVLAFLKISKIGFFGRSLLKLILYLPENLLVTLGLLASQKIKDKEYQAMLLSNLALQLHLPEVQRRRVLAKALATVRMIKNERIRARMLCYLVPQLPKTLLTKVLVTVREIKHEKVRANVLRKLVPHLPEALSKALLTEALVVAREIKHEGIRADVLSRLAPCLPETLSAEALAITREINNEGKREKVLSKLRLRLPETLAEAFTMAGNTGDEKKQVRVLKALAPCLPEALLAEALAMTGKIKDEWQRARVLGKLAPRLPEALLAKVFTMAEKIGNEWCQAEVLDKLASRRLPEALLAEALVMTGKIGDEGQRARILLKLVPHLLRLPAMRLHLFWSKTLPVLANRTRSDLLNDIGVLTPVIIALGGEKAIVETFHAIRDVGRWWP